MRFGKPRRGWRGFPAFGGRWVCKGELVDAEADGIDQLGGTIVGFRDGVGGVGATVEGAGDEGDGLDIGPAIVGEGEGVVAILGREGVAEDHNFDGGGGGELTDVGETGGGVHVEAGLVKDKAVGVNELVVVAKH